MITVFSWAAGAPAEVTEDDRQHLASAGGIRNLADTGELGDALHDFWLARARGALRHLLFSTPMAPYEPAEVLFGRIAEAVDRTRSRPLAWDYDSLDIMVQRLMRANPRLGLERALFMASELGEVLSDGSVRMRIDPAWRDTLTQLMMTPEIYKSAWRRIEAQVLLIGAPESYVLRGVRASAPEDFDARLACLKSLRHVTLEDAGHNVHHDQPEAVAALLDDFFGAALSQACAR